jgi:hypothetical protein
MLPLALTAVADYAERSARALDDLRGRCVNDDLPRMTAPTDLARELPSEALKTLADFIEYSDAVDVSILETTAHSYKSTMPGSAIW